MALTALEALEAATLQCFPNLNIGSNLTPSTLGCFSNLSGISATVKCGCTLHSLVSGVSNVTAHFQGESASLRD